MEVVRALRMVGGDGENSYATNSRLPKKAILETKPVLQKAIDEVSASVSSPGRIVVADLGCSSGPNTLLVVSEVIGMVSEYSEKTEVQFFLNDLSGNDFNLVFRSLEQFQRLAGKEALPLPYYVAGLPGSFYRRLFPCRSVHLFHSSYALMWRSKVPEELAVGAYLNEGNIYIGRTTPLAVVKLFKEQFQKDLSLFLTLRSKELVSGGHMVLTFLGRKSTEMITHGEVGTMWELLAQAFQFLVRKSRVKEEDLTTFNLPFYSPSVDEVEALIEENQLFDVQHIGLFESNWDPHDDDSNGDAVLDCARSGGNIAKCSIRAVIEPLITGHFGASIIDELFVVFTAIVSKHLEKGKAMYPVIVVSLKARH